MTNAPQRYTVETMHPAQVERRLLYMARTHCGKVDPREHDCPLCREYLALVTAAEQAAELTRLREQAAAKDAQIATLTRVRDGLADELISCRQNAQAMHLVPDSRAQTEHLVRELIARIEAQEDALIRELEGRG